MEWNFSLVAVPASLKDLVFIFTPPQIITIKKGGKKRAALAFQCSKFDENTAHAVRLFCA